MNKNLYLCDKCNQIYKPQAWFDCLGQVHAICSKCYSIIATKNLFTDEVVNQDPVPIEAYKDFIVCQVIDRSHML